MRYSEAMRLGATLGPQEFGCLWKRHTDGASCAEGSALRAIGLDKVQNPPRELRAKAFPWVYADNETLCPECGMKLSRVSSTVIHLNNDHKMSRNDIADWVATIEPQEPTTALEVTESPTVEKSKV